MGKFGWICETNFAEFLFYAGVALKEIKDLIQGLSSKDPLDWVLLIPRIYGYVIVPLEKGIGLKDPFPSVKNKWLGIAVNARLFYNFSTVYIGWLISISGTAGLA